MGAVEYAEHDLGVHAAYEEAQRVHGELDNALMSQASHTSSIRMLHERIEDREQELLRDLRANDPTASQAALDRAFKDERRTDDALIDLREQLLSTSAALDTTNAKVDAAKYRLRVLTARMNELGGLLAFYAATRSSSAREA